MNRKAIEWRSARISLPQLDNWRIKGTFKDTYGADGKAKHGHETQCKIFFLTSTRAFKQNCTTQCCNITYPVKQNIRVPRSCIYITNSYISDLYV